MVKFFESMTSYQLLETALAEPNAKFSLSAVMSNGIVVKVSFPALLPSGELAERSTNVRITPEYSLYEKIVSLLPDSHQSILQSAK